MTPAPAVAARNIKSAAEGKIIMTDKELQRAIQKVSRSLNKLSNSEKPLTKAEKRHRQILSLQKETLQKIKEARAKNDFSQENDLTVTYGLLTSLGEKHPFLMGFLQSKFKWHVY